MTDLGTRLSNVSTSHVCDALAHIGYSNFVLQGLRPLTEPGLTMAGPASILELVRSRTPEDPRRMGVFLDEHVTEGAVVVIAAHGICDYVCVGGRASARAKAVGAVGMVVDGGVRDIPELQGNDFPIHARDRGLHASEGFLNGIRINETAYVAGVKVEPGDWMVADDSGVIVVPADVVERVTELAEEREEVDQETMVQISQGGATIAEAHRHFRDDDTEYFRRVE
jgi:4-hydroxy-4-methyl-2-oxoglutarate aldolase